MSIIAHFPQFPNTVLLGFFSTLPCLTENEGSMLFYLPQNQRALRALASLILGPRLSSKLRGAVCVTWSPRVREKCAQRGHE